MKFSSKTMTLKNTETVPYLVYNSLEEIKFIRHGFSTRLGGVSKGIFSSMNLAFNRGDNIDDVLKNYTLLSESVGVDFNSLVASSQDHNTFVRNVTEAHCGIGITKPRDILSVDGLITDRPGVTLTTYYADCTPLFFVDINRRAIGLAHAGWRGTAGRIGERVVRKMQEDFGTDLRDLVCAVGPAISSCCYEVDADCADNFYRLSDLDTDRFILPKKNNKFMLDLPEANRQILVAAGVEEENITLSDLCTCCNSELLWSHRATKGQRGTMCAVLCLNE